MILLGFFCYITHEIGKRQERIINNDVARSTDKSSQSSNTAARYRKTTLTACFDKAGLKRADWNKRSVSYSMAENALLFYKDKKTLDTDQLELVLRMVRERMGVHIMHRQEAKKEYFDHKLPRKCLGGWLMAQLALQNRVKQLAQEQSENQKFDRDDF